MTMTESMAISHAAISSGDKSARDDKWNPRLGQLELGRVRDRCDFARSQRRRHLTSGERRDDLLQRVPCGDLRAPTTVFESPHALAARRPRHDALGFEHLETRRVDRLERKRGLKPLD